MKKIIMFLASLLLLSSCGGNSHPSSSLDVDILEEDKIKPQDTDLDYIDYSTLGEKPDFNQTMWYRNDLKEVPLPDPYVLEVGDTYYIYGTTDRTGSKSLDCYSTKDFNTYTFHQDIYKKTDSTWNSPSIFAPEVMEFDGMYYLYYSDQSILEDGLRYISVMVSSSPIGPFIEYQGEDAYGNYLDGKEAPIFTHNKTLGISALDQHVFVDGDSMYMYYSLYDTGIMQYIVGVEMIDPVTCDWSTYKILVYPGEINTKTKTTNILSWEKYHDFKVAEGPFMLKSPINNKYYLTYSVNHYPDRYYSVCYAVSDSPLGDYEKPYTKGQQWTNLLFGYAGGPTGSVYDKWKGFMSGTAHHCFFKVGDEYMIGYHAHKNRDNNSNGRMFGMDHLYFDKEGVPYTYGPSYSLQPLPEKISGYKNIALNAKVKSFNVNNAERINDNYVVEHYNLEQNKGKEVTLLAGKSYIELVFDKEYSIAGLNLYNSAFYDKALSQISYINFDNNNVILDGGFNNEYINEELEFINPCSAFTFEFNEIKASRVVLGFDTTIDTNINELWILGV